MTLAEHIAAHIASPPSDTFGAVLSSSLSLRSIINSLAGQPISLRDGLKLIIPTSATYTKADLPDGGVQLGFNGNLPVVVATSRLGPFHADLTAVVLRIGSAAIEITCHAKKAFLPLPPYTVVITL